MSAPRTRPYRGESDVVLLMDFTSELAAATGGVGSLHPGDVPHHIYSGNRIYDVAELMTIWEDDLGLAAWVLVSPRYRGYDAQVRADLRGGSFEREVIAHGDVQTIEMMRRHGIEGDLLVGDADREDAIRIEIMLEQGWELDGDPPWVVNRARLGGIPEPSVPHGYSIRAVTGLGEAGPIGELHKAAFGAQWTPETYRRYMEAPGYAPEREFVVVAPDESLAAFTVTWHDEPNHMGYLEPVGTHPDHRRKGLGKAVVLHAMRAMAAAGMEWASVMNEGANEASRELYRSCGFEPWHLVDGYVKKIR